jgi:23S rRNA (adenine2030-N6)-methyltransferase
LVHYRHSYHAGNFADVFKHVLLTGLLLALNRKDKPWCYYDTHAGTGDYDLGGEGAERTGEWREGVGRLDDETGAPQLAAEYLRLLREARARRGERHYPGSPQFACALARSEDRLVLCEKVPEVAAALRQSLRGDPRVAIHLRYGYEAHALLPPAQKRGLVLIDPPFERTDEFEAIAGLIEKSAARFAGGVCAAWFPVKDAHRASRFVRRVARDTARPVLDLRFDTGESAEGQMHACGLLVVNPPFGFEPAAAAALQWLQPRLAQGPRAGCSVTPV